jgi:predicted AAA+ superfamily ATPase
MKNKYINRSIEKLLIKATEEFPAVVLTGPRQSGKTTVLKKIFENTYKYVSMELPDVRASANVDPRGFLEAFSPPVILDEIQFAPDLLFYIKEYIDANRTEKGLFILTGSQNLLLMEKVTETLAGRAAILHLMPLTKRETLGEPETPLNWEIEENTREYKELSFRDLWQYLTRGFYPEIVANPDRDWTLWYGSYVQTYLERDIRTLRQIGDLNQFQSFIRALAARSGQLLNLAEMSRDLGVALNTVKHWISVLEASFQIIILRPYYANISKRLVKTPKVYFIDTGLLCYLCGLKDPEHAASGPMGGAIFETAVITEVYKTLIHRGVVPNLYFWRTSAGVEVDLIVDTGRALLPLEVKLTSTPQPKMAGSIKTIMNDLSDKINRGYVIHTGNSKLPLVTRVTALPFSNL